MSSSVPAAAPQCTAYTVGTSTVLHCSHTLPPLLGHCPADSYLLHPPPASSFPSLVFSLRHHPSLSSTDTLRTQVFTFLTSLLALRHKRRQPLLHGDVVSFEGDTHIGREVNRGVVLASLPPDAWAAFEGSLAGEAKGGGERGALFSLLVSAGEIRLVERAGMTRLLGLRAWREAERERRERSDDSVRFYPFPVYSDLTRTHSLAASPPLSAPAEDSKARPQPARSLSKREQLQQKLKARKAAEPKPQAASDEGEDEVGDALPASSMLDRLQVFPVHGSAVYRAGRFIRLEVRDEAEMRAAVRRAQEALKAGGKRPIVLSTGLPQDGEPLKVWLPPVREANSTAEGTAATVAVLNRSEEAEGDGGRVYGSFLCLFPSGASAVDEGKESEDGFVLFLTAASFAALLQYLERGLKLAMMADSAQGLHFHLSWTGMWGREGAADGEGLGDDAELLQRLRSYVKGSEAVQLTAVALPNCGEERRRRPDRQAVVEFAVWLCRPVEAELERRRQAEGGLAGTATALVGVQRDGAVTAEVQWRSVTGANGTRGEWGEVEALMRKAPVPASLLRAAGEEGAGGGPLSMSFTFDVH